MPTDRQAKKAHIERPGFKHSNLIRGEDIAQRELYIGIQLSKQTNDIGYQFAARR